MYGSLLRNYHVYPVNPVKKSDGLCLTIRALISIWKEDNIGLRREHGVIDEIAGSQ